MLGTRLLTAAVAVPLLLGAIAAGGWWWEGIVLAAAICAAAEYAGFAAVPRGLLDTALYVVLAASFFLVCVHLGNSPLLLPLVGVCAVLVVSQVVLLPGTVEDASRVAMVRLAGLLHVSLLLSFAVTVRARPQGAWWLLLLLAVTWLNDSGAYFAGRSLGRHPLHPRLSPKKTWEGALGGLAGSSLAVLAVRFLGLGQIPLRLALLLALAASVAGPLGDLAESLLKRRAGLKDSGSILPGHGGILDRVDALLFNAPLVALLATWVGRG